MTMGEKLAAAKGRPAGFDYLRLCLALSIVLNHIIPVSLGDEVTRHFYSGTFRPLFAFVLPMFFALSGFLVAGSLTRTKSLSEFYALRIIRLFPALAVEVLLSAFLIGAAFTTLPLSKYFTHPGFYSYFLNMVGRIHFSLPGVFETNPHPNTINEQLWTIPYELDCYLALGACALIGITKRRRLFLAAVVAAHLMAFFRYGNLPPDLWIPVKGHVLVLSFLVGVVFFFYRDRMIWSYPIFYASLILMYALLLLPDGDLLVSVPATYATVFLGVTNATRNRMLLSGDYSYGIYLYGFPIQQAFAHLWPGLNAATCAAIVVTIGFAAGSWWLIERPALEIRKLIFYPRTD
jgi:peptidoglycan/LPS O-acetylase OafA/YrhL